MRQVMTMRNITREKYAMEINHYTLSPNREDTVFASLQFLNIVTGGTTVWDTDSRTAILTTKRR